MAKVTKKKAASSGSGYKKITALLQQAYKSDPRGKAWGEFLNIPGAAGNMGLRREVLGQNPNIASFQHQRHQVPQTVASLMKYLTTQGYNKKDAKSALKQYLRQDLGLAGFMPNKYRAPGKTDLVNAALGGLGQMQQSGQDAGTQDAIGQYVEAMRSMQLQQADTYEQSMYDKVAKIKDPDRQAVAATAVSNMANLMRFSANDYGENAFGLGSNRNNIAQILGQYNSGQNTLLNRLNPGTPTADTSFSDMVMGSMPQQQQY